MNGVKVYSVLVAHKIKQSEVASKLGISKQALNSLLSVEDIKTGTLERIATASGLPLSEFFGFDTSDELKTAVNEINKKLDLLIGMQK